MVVELRRTYKHVLTIFVCTGDLLLVFISISQEREEDLCKFWAYVLMLSLPVSSLPSWNLCHCVLQRSRYLPNSQVLQVQVGWKRGIVIALPEGQSYSVSLHPIGCDRMDVRAALAINLPTVENTVVGAVEPEDTTQWISGIQNCDI